MSQPVVPPRPQRQTGQTAVNQNMPQIPPRPSRKLEPSPSRDAARSPFNEPPTAMSNGKIYGHSNLSASDLPARPPSVSSMPTIGQEGSEYASFDNLPAEAHGISGSDNKVETQTRHADVPMMQPTASVPVKTAKERISTVTRTDSSQAAAAGIGKPRGEDDVHSAQPGSPLRRVTSRDEGNSLSRVSSREPHRLRENSSFNRSSSNVAGGRPGSVYDDEHEHGIPEIGLQVPMYPNAGDVQAPSPGPSSTMFPGGIGFFNDGSSRNHHRKRSSRHEFGPPGSYGLHGHPGQEPSDQFEREWIMKHPDEAAKEGYNVYGGLAPRPATAMSSAQLNHLVHSNSDLGMGTSAGGTSTPSQEIGWEASEQYTSRMNSPKPSPLPLSEMKKRPSSGNQPPAESPLRKASFPTADTAHLRDDVLDSEDDNVIHIDGRRQKEGSKVTGGGAKDNKLDLRSLHEHEQRDGTPILASDELEKRPGSAFMQPAVSPEAERSDWLDANYNRRGSATGDSRPSSRPGSIHGNQLSRFISHEERPGSGMGTPLEEIEEYEPLFPEDDDPKSAPAKNFKRPGMAQHHFPSQDVWEDTPASLQFTTSVETPEPIEENNGIKESPPAAAVFETPEQEQARRQMGGSMLSDKKTFAKPHFRSSAHHEAERPGLQRFPSHDIWEDTPDSMRLETTVSGPQEPEIKSPEDERPTTTALASSQDDDDARATTGMSQLMRPHIPSRPIRSSKLSQDITPEIAPVDVNDSREKEVPDLGALQETSPTKTKAPSLPDKPKPSIPARPLRAPKPDDSQAISPESATAPKAKPAVPARPAGGKFANLKSGFMSDLASRIQLGPTGPPPKPKEPEPEAEEHTAPLADARKSRAKGPPRRKRATSPPAAAEPLKANPISFSLSTPVTVWHIDSSDVLHVPGPSHEAAHPQDDKLAEAEKILAANATANSNEAAPAPVQEQVSSEKDLQPQISNTSAASEQEPTSLSPSTTKFAQVGAEGDEPAESISAPVQQQSQEIHSTLEAALSNAQPLPTSAEETQSKAQTADVSEVAQLNAKPTELEGGVSGYTGAKDPEMDGNVVIREGDEVGRQQAD